MRKADSKLLVVSGPTAAGKDTVLDALKKECQTQGLGSRIIRSCSTKTPRLSEAGCPNYEYLDASTFHQRINDNFFIEYCRYIQGTHTEVLVGTSAEQLVPQCKHEHIAWKVSLDRFAEIINVTSSDTQFFQKVIVPIFLGVPQLMVLYFRAKRRAATTEEWETRLKPNFRKRIAYEFAFWCSHQDTLRPYVIQNNGSLKQTCAQIVDRVKS